MNKLLKVLTLSLLVMALVVGCSGGETPKTPEEIAEAEYKAFEEQAVEIAKEFVLATQGDKEKIKELSFPALLEDIEAKNWSIMLVDEITINPETLETTTEKMGDRQIFVRVFYEGEMNVDGDVIPVKLSNKLGVIKQDDKALVFVVE